jgi:hypothetical protein
MKKDSEKMNTESKIESKYKIFLPKSPSLERAIRSIPHISMVDRWRCGLWGHFCDSEIFWSLQNLLQ